MSVTASDVRRGRGPRGSGSSDARVSLAGSSLFVNLVRVAVVVSFLLLWETAANRGWVNPTFSGKPSAVWDALVDYWRSGRMVSSTAATMTAVFWAFVIGTISGTIAGLILGMSPLLDRTLGVFMVPLNSVPRIAMAPLFILWFGLTTSAKVALAITIVFFILAVNARSTVKSIDDDLVVMSRVIGLSRVQRARMVVLPSAVPTIFAGVRLAITYSLLGVVASEMIAARDGIGQDIVYFSNRFAVSSVIAILLELAVLATVINVGLEWIERRLLRWQRR